MPEFKLTRERKILYNLNEDETVPITWLSDDTYSNCKDVKYGDIIYMEPICIDILNHKNVDCYGMFDSQSNEEVLYRIGFECIEDYFKILANEFATYAFLFIRQYNKHNKKSISILDFEEVIFKDKPQVTVEEALKHLNKKLTFRKNLLSNQTILNGVKKFNENILNCSVGHMRISRSNRKGFTEMENMFNDEFFRGLYYNRFCLKHTDIVAKKLNLSVDLINEMCLTGKLLNTEQELDGWYVETKELCLKINETELEQNCIKHDVNEFLDTPDLIQNEHMINNVIPLRRKVD